MFVSVEISYYPLNDGYRGQVLAVVERLEKSGLEVYSGRMSTQLFGEFDEVMRVLNDTMHWAFETYGRSVFTTKVVQGDRRPR
jgi:uncharacterized protein YqgV (UPF0045/DUF77 family)